MNLKEFLRKKGRSQKWLLEQLSNKGINVSYQHLNRWSKGMFSPRHEYVYIAIADCLEVSVDEIKSLFNK